MTNTIYSLSGATLTELYRWDFGDLNNDIENLKFRPNMSKQEQIQYVKDAYSSKSVNYVIDSQGQNRRYRYAMVVRKNKYIHLFYNREKHDLLQFERTKEGLQLYPIYFGEDFILCTPEGGLPLNDLFPEKLRNEDQQRIIQSHSEEENPILVKYVFKNEE
ncbi:6-bladed beta-propeller [Parabacteroides distasonis]|uniref:6-bladed beta-propeller n=1 Tax=Parabacteroides distasonis TaxID=823 RepID=UPI003D05F779